jgi:hypothetical protein
MIVVDKCEECLVGRCQPSALPYIHKFGPHLIVLPNAPATRCDMCGHIAFEPTFLLAMHALLEQTARAQMQARTPAPPLKGRSQRWTPAGRDG